MKQYKKGAWWIVEDKDGKEVYRGRNRPNALIDYDSITPEPRMECKDGVCTLVDEEPADSHTEPAKGMDVSTALLMLDPGNDEHWTKAGLPAMHIVEELCNDETISRKDVAAARPGFKRGM